MYGEKYNSIMENSTTHFIHLLSALPAVPEVLSFFTLIFCFVSVLAAAKFFGRSGLYAYSLIATIASNIQVLKLTQYSFVAEPIALGTVLFSTTFAVDNILTEYYRTEAAKKGLYISFFGYLFFVIVMQIAVLHPQVSPTDCTNLHRELEEIFSPALSIFVSSLLAYFAGQRTDIFVYSSLKKVVMRYHKNSQKYMAARSMISMGISSFVDNCVFSFFAWIVFAKNPISLEQLWSTYIFVTYILRLTIAALCVPLVHLAGRFISTDSEKNGRRLE